MNDEAGDRLLQHCAALLERCRVKDLPRVLHKVASDPNALLSAYERSVLIDSGHGQLVRDAEKARQAAQDTREAQARARAPVEAAVCPTGIVFRNALLQALNQHAIDVAVQHGITVTRHERGECGQAHQEERRISVPAVTSEICYAIFLHEVAHIVCPEADSRQHHYRIEKRDDGGRSRISPSAEIAAWRWASSNARHWTLAMQERMYQSLHAHSLHATADERHEMVACVKAACFRVSGKAWTFEELAARGHALEGTPIVPTPPKPKVRLRGPWQPTVTYATDEAAVRLGLLWRCSAGPTQEPPGPAAVCWKRLDDPGAGDLQL